MAERKTRKLKKSETLEVRLDHETKRDFIETCRENGTTASDVVRSGIDRYLARNKNRSGRPTLETPVRMSAMIVPFVAKKKRVLAAGAGAVALGALVAMPSAAGPDMKAAFARLDANGDGRLTMEEFLGPEAAPGHRVERRIEEIIETDDAPAGADGVVEEKVEIREDAFAVLLPPEDATPDGRWGVSMSIMRSIKGSDPGAVDVPGDPRSEEFSGMDTNGDGDVSLNEFQARMRMLFTHGFELLDGDGDGGLTQAEFARSGEAEQLLDRADGAPRSRPSGAQQELGAEQVRVGFETLDGNGDGRVSLDEYLASI